MSGAPERFDGNAAWRDLPPHLKDEVGAIALELVAAWYAGTRAYEDALPASFGRMAEAAGDQLLDQLSGIVHDETDIDFDAAGGMPMIPSRVEADLCSACVPGDAHG